MTSTLLCTFQFCTFSKMAITFFQQDVFSYELFLLIVRSPCPPLRVQGFLYYFFICELKHWEWIYYLVSHESSWVRKKKSTYPEMLHLPEPLGIIPTLSFQERVRGGKNQWPSTFGNYSKKPGIINLCSSCFVEKTWPHIAQTFTLGELLRPPPCESLQGSLSWWDAI